jgi:hypothetical protein
LKAFPILYLSVVIIIELVLIIDLFEVRSCSAYREKQRHVAIVVEINDMELKKIYHGSFLI